MKKKFLILITIIFILFSLQATAEETNSESTVIRYDCKNVEELPDSGSGLGEPDMAVIKHETEMIFEPVGNTSGWLSDLAGGETLKVNIGMLNFDCITMLIRYIDIEGKNGKIRYLQNSGSAEDN